MGRLHWQYFLTLDEDMRRLSRYIEIHEANFPVYSIELVRIILSACSEIDVIAKALYPSKSNHTMKQYATEIPMKYPQLPGQSVHVPGYGIELHPWQSWQNGEIPSWWTDHNKVKHRRSTSYDRANLGNALYAVAGLFVLALYSFRINPDWDGTVGVWPEFFNTEKEHHMEVAFIMDEN